MDLMKGYTTHALEHTITSIPTALSNITDDIVLRISDETGIWSGTNNVDGREGTLSLCSCYENSFMRSLPAQLYLSGEQSSK